MLWNQYREGLVREIYSPGGPGAVLIVEASSRDSARSALGELPLLADKVMSLELIELHPFTALEMLFSRESSWCSSRVRAAGQQETRDLRVHPRCASDKER